MLILLPYYANPLMIALKWAIVVSTFIPNIVIKGVKFSKSNFNSSTSYDMITKMLLRKKLVYLEQNREPRPIVNRDFDWSVDDISELYSQEPAHCHQIYCCPQLTIALLFAF